MKPTISKMKGALALGALAVSFGTVSTGASAQEVRFMCSSDGNECDTYREILDKFEAANDGITVLIEDVPYKAILENLPIQLAAGTGPDIAKVTDLGGLSQYYLDLSPYVDGAYWDANFGATQPWYRKSADDAGIYGMHSQLTVTGPFVNLTLFEQAGVEVPGNDADWDTWAAAANKVAKATGVTYPMAMDRSGHRIAGPAISYGAKLFDDNGDAMLVDDAFTAYVEKFVGWHNDGTMARDVWGGSGGSSYQDAKAEFISGDLVYYFSGSWQIQKMSESIGDDFDWKVVGSPCGTGGCTGMPGGAGVVGFEQTEHPEAVAKVIDFLAQQDNYNHLTAKTLNIPAHAGVASAPVDYIDATPAASQALNAFAAQVAGISPIAIKYQGYKHNRAMFNITLQRVSQAIVGELTVEEAMERAKSDLAEAMAATE
ncbi:ABC transporter substrate-binding protein [Shimia sp. Alg240-R146]|uniref:ABC transporter substrate-binding protein n=1 Tax=Shimia sp. Alg240-R146 TaxID=2993449 RepID=UPI0022E32448|nr:ABC transporter substrate-binding protein [Shimia sp. Alg240-R146]